MPSKEQRDMKPTPRTFLPAAFLGLALWASGCSSLTPLQPGAVDWKVEYHVKGGEDGKDLLLTLTSDGQLVAENRRLGTRATRSAPAELTSKMTGLVRKLVRAGGLARGLESSPETVSVASMLVVRNRRYPIALPEDVSELLSTSLREALKDTKAAPLNLGRIWKIEEGFAGDETDWEGTWVRRGQSNLFDARWNNCWLNETKSDVIEVEVAENGQVVLLRHGIGMRYRGSFSPAHPHKLTGTADWYGPGVVWRATIEY